MAITNLQDFAYQLREVWARRGPPKSVMEELGEFCKMLKKMPSRAWAGQSTARLPVDTQRDGNIGPNYANTYANHVAETGQQYLVPAREFWTTVQLNWEILHFGTANALHGTAETAEQRQFVRKALSFWKALSYYCLGDGTNRISKGDGQYDVAGTTIQLLNINTVNRFEVEDQLILIDENATVPTNGRPTPRAFAANQSLKITEINRATGTLTVETAISTAVPTAVNTDYVGKLVDSGVDRGAIDGTFRWSPITNTEAVQPFAGVNRAQDPTRLSRRAFKVEPGMSPWEICTRIMVEAFKTGKPVDTIYITSNELTAMSAEMKSILASAQVRTVTTPTDLNTLRMGVSALEVQMVGLPPAKIVADRYLADINTTAARDRTYFGVYQEDWQLLTSPLGINWQIAGAGQGGLIQVPGAQTLFSNYGGYGNLIAAAPGNNVVASPRVEE